MRYPRATIGNSPDVFHAFSQNHALVRSDDTSFRMYMSWGSRRTRFLLFFLDNRLPMCPRHQRRRHVLLIGTRRRHRCHLVKNFPFSNEVKGRLTTTFEHVIGWV